MRIEQLMYLLEINKTHSINAASENLNITHQSLNRSIKNMENELDAPLLVRTSKGVTLTKQGKRVLETAQMIVGAVEELKKDLSAQKVTGHQDALEGILSIAISPLAYAVLMPAYSDAFSKRHPLVNLFMREASPTEVLQRILDGTCEIGIANIRRQEIEYYKESIKTRILLQDSAVVLVSKNSPLAQNKSVSLKTIIDYPFVLYATDINREHWVFPYLMSMGKSIKRYIFTNSISIFVDNIASGNYISFYGAGQFQMLREDLKKEMTIIPLRNKSERELLTFQLALCTRRGSDLSKPAEAFIEMLF